MKKVFSIFLVFCAAFAYADTQSTIEEVDDQEFDACVAMTFAESPIFEEDEVSSNDEIDDVSASTCDECGDECSGNCREEYQKEGSETASENQPLDQAGQGINASLWGFSQDEENELETSYSRWPAYRMKKFDPEIIYIRFPSEPIEKHNHQTGITTVYAFDHAVYYSFDGYYPICPHVYMQPKEWFDTILNLMSYYPYNLISHSVCIMDRVLEFEALDVVQNMIIKGKAIVTPCNAYLLQCMKPVGMKDQFDHFLKNFIIKCNYCR